MKETQEKYYTSLYEIAAAVNSAYTPEAVLRTIVEMAAKAMNKKGCSLMLLTPDRRVLFHTASYGLSDRYIRKGPISAEQSIAETLEGKAVTVSDAAEDDRVQYREQAGREGIASILSAPMMLREEIIGVIRVYSSEPYHFTPDDVHFAEAVGSLSAIAVENTRLYEAIRKNREALGRQLLEWHAAKGVWPPRAQEQH